MSIESEIKNVRLSEIDADIIPMIRPLNDKSEDYRILENAINEDGQRSPITIRFLSEEEKQNAHAGAIYGIIDGHHRYHIAQKFNRETIMSKVDDTPADPVRDAMLAFRMNSTSIRMSPAEKGKVICELMNATNLDMNAVGEKVFGLKSAMIYRCVQKYKELIGEPIIKKPRKDKQEYNSNLLKENFTKLFGGTYGNYNLSNSDQLKKKLELIKDIKTQLRLLEKHLSNMISRVEDIK